MSSLQLLVYFFESMFSMKLNKKDIPYIHGMPFVKISIDYKNSLSTLF